MSNYLYSFNDLMERSRDYFTANPDVSFLAAVTGTGNFYRPEREDAARYEAGITGTSAIRIHRSDVEKALTAGAGDAEVPELPAVVGTLELVLASGKLEGTTPHELAEVIYWTALQNGMSQAGAEEMLATLADFLMTKMAQGMTAISLTKTEAGAVITVETPAAPAVDSAASTAPTDALPAAPTAPAAPAVDSAASTAPTDALPAAPTAPAAPAVDSTAGPAPTDALPSTPATPAKPAKVKKAKATPKKKAATEKAAA
jgi:hypothetical protein